MEYNKARFYSTAINEDKLLMKMIKNIVMGLLLVVAHQHYSSLFCWQINLNLELHDTEVQKFSLGVQTDNSLMKQIYANKLFFNVNYNKDTGFYFDAKTKKAISEKFKKKDRIEQFEQSLSQALIQQLSTYLIKIYTNNTQKNTEKVNLLPINRYNRVVIPFESIVNNVINNFAAGFVSRDYVKEVYNEVQKSLTHAKREYLNTTKKRKKLVLIGGKLSFYDETQELREKINMLEILVKKLDFLLSAKVGTV